MSNAALKRVVEGSGPAPSAQQSWNSPGPSGFGPAGQVQQGFGPQGYGPQGYGQPAPGYAPGGYPQGYAPGQQGPVQSASSYMDMNDVVVKTGISIATVIVSALVSWFALIAPLLESNPDAVYPILVGSMIAGLVVGLVNSFKRNPSAPLVLLYCVLEGVFVGGISGLFETMFPGIVFQAMLGTMGVFVGMLIVYRTGAIRVTPKFQRWLAAALIGAVLLGVFNLVYFMITGENSLLRDGGPMAIGFSLLMIGIAAFTFLADFDMAEQAIRRGAPKNFAWGIAFGLIVSIVWLYLEILRLLSYFRE